MDILINIAAGEQIISSSLGLLINVAIFSIAVTLAYRKLICVV